MSFNPDITKQAQEVNFSRKLRKPPHSPLTFNTNKVNKTSSQKRIGIILDEDIHYSLSSKVHLKTILFKTNKALCPLRKLKNLPPRPALITLYKSFIIPEVSNSSFHKKHETIQYNASLAITGAIRCSSREILYNELYLELLYARQWYQKLCYLYNFYVLKQLEYLFNLTPVRTSNYKTKDAEDVPYFNLRNNFFKNLFVPSAVIEWNKLNSRI